MDIDRAYVEFSPKDSEAEKEKVSRSVALRREQPKFRKKLLSAYQHTCAITGTSFSPILEAAHIVPYMGEKPITLRTEYCFGLIFIPYKT